MTADQNPTDAAPSPLKRALVALDQMQTRLEQVEAAQHQPIALVGVGCRLPGGVFGPTEFWEFLMGEGDGIVEVPPDRWDIDAYYDPDPDAPGKIASRHGGFIEDVADFDPQFFGISPREAAGMDPQQRLLLEVAWESLENAAIAPDGLQGSKTGVFLGLTSADYAKIQMDAKGVDGIDAYYASGAAASTASGRLSYVLGLHGPSLTVDTACSSSLVAVHLAVRSLRSGESDLALAGGVNLILAPENSIALSRYHMLAPDGRCKTFDAAADGFVRGEGCGMVVLKRLDDAVAADDPILAVIRGSAVNQDGASNGLTAPNGPAQTAVIRAALADAELRPEQVGYVEAHGTGTSLGDPIEVQALADALGPERSLDDPIAIGSVKTNVGHLEGVAGVTGLIKAALVVHHGTIPPHRNFESPSPHIAWDELPVRVPTDACRWSKDGRPTAGVSAFGFSGTNAHVILEAPPARPKPDDEKEPALLVLPVSAASQQALDLALGNARDTVSGPTPLVDVVAGYAEGRAGLHQRAVAFGTDRTELVTSLDALIGPGADDRWRQRARDEHRVGMLFTGQGSQWPGMARELHRHEPVFRSMFDSIVERFDDALASELPVGSSLADIMFGRADAHRLSDTVFTQPALFAMQCSLTELWKSWGIEPSILLGHSIGEIAAATVAEIMTIDDAVRLVAARGSLMQQLPPGGAMAAVFSPVQDVERAIAGTAPTVAVAAVNGPANTVVSGDEAGVAAIVRRFSDDGVKVTPLEVRQAFHSPLMDPMLDDFRAVAGSINYRPAQRRLVSNVSGRLAGPEISTAEYWVEHVSAPVRFSDGIAAMAETGVTAFVEVGPHPVLTAMAQVCLPDHDAVWASSLRRDRDDHRQMLEGVADLWTSGLPIDWASLGLPRGGRRISVPTTPFDRQRYWVPRTRPKVQPGAHPLLGVERRSPLAETTFVNELVAETLDYLDDHRVFGTAILPATAYLEAASVAARAVRPGHRGLADVVVSEPFIAEPDHPRTITTVVRRDTNRTTVEVFSADEDSVGGPEGWTRHVTATVLDSADIRVTTDIAKPVGKADAVDIQTRLAACDRSMEVDEHYQALADMGLELGPSLQTVRSISVGSREAIGRIELDSGVARTAYHTHPALLDGCIQVLAALAGQNSDAYLPLGIDQVRYHRESSPDAVWSIATLDRPLDPNGDVEVLAADVVVCDDDGKIVLELIGLRLKRADRAAMLRLGAAARVDDWFYEVAWPERELLDAGVHPAATAGVDPAAVAAEVFGASDQVAAEVDLDAYESALAQLEAYSTAAIHTALRQLGVRFEVGEQIDAASLGVAANHRAQFNQLMGFLVDDGVVTVSGQHWEVIAEPGPADRAADLEAWQDRYPLLTGEIGIAQRCGGGLGAALTGDADPLALLFPGGSIDSAEAMYQLSPFAGFYSALAARAVAAITDRSGEERPLRILEVGGGTGGTTARVLPRLGSRDVRYTFTDISPHFLPRAREKFVAHPFIDYATLDIETDPTVQGFAAGSFDLVLATNVLHATADLATTFRHIHELLAPGGQLVMTEMIRPQRFIAISFGLTEGWWRFTDTDLRPDSLLLERDRWLTFLADNGFDAPSSIPPAPSNVHDGRDIQAVFVARRGTSDGTGSNPPVLVVCEDGSRGSLDDALTAKRHAVSFVHPDEDLTAAVRAAREAGTQHVLHAASLGLDPDAHTLLASAVRLATAVVQEAAGARLTFVTVGAQPLGGAADPDQAALVGLARTLSLEHPELEIRTVDLDPAAAMDPLTDLVSALGADDGEELVAYRSGRRNVARLRPAAAVADAGPVELTFTERGSIDNLRLVPLTRPAPGPGQVEIRVHAAALNFKDVLNVLGMYPGDPGPLGGEVAGEVTAVGEGVHNVEVGQSVAALAPAFRSYTVCDARFVVPKPPALTYAQASAVLIPAVTATFSLDHLGRIGTGDRVLVHAAAGGVGSAAVHVARAAGAEVFATAGSPAKRAHLRSLGVEHVYDSRSVEFAERITKDTGGNGVDLVLNSLTGPAAHASLALLAPGGRFLELGKSDLDEGAEAARRAGVEYHAIDWTDDLRQTPELIQDHLRRAMELTESNVLPAPLVTTFPLERSVDAFRFMAQARHTGKVVLTRDGAVTEGEATPIRPDGTYLITGGLRGLGLLIASALIEDGARALALVARSEPEPETLTRIEEWRNNGVAVHVFAADVSRREDMATVLDAIDRSGPPLIGVFHSAGVLDQAAFTRMSWDQYETVLAPKVLGAKHLHELTADRALDRFVLFSSIASVLGAAGQANHAAANAYLDGLAAHRRSLGRPGQSISWGAWSEIGSAAARGVDREAMAGAMGALTPDEGLAALRRAMDRKVVHVAVNRGNLADVVADVVADGPGRPYFSDLATESAAEDQSSVPQSVLPDIESAPPARRREVLADFVRACAARVLDLGVDRIDDLTPLSDIGLDSLMAVELRNVLGSGLEQEDPLSATLVFDYPSVDALTGHLLAVLDGVDSAPPPVAEPSTTSLLDDLEQLSDEEFARRLADRRSR